MSTGVLSCLTDEMRNQSSGKLHTREAAKQGRQVRVEGCGLRSLTERIDRGPHAASLARAQH